MSYDIRLVDLITRETLTLAKPHHMKGGTYCLGGELEAHLNITYNYSACFEKVLGNEGIRSIYGKRGADTIAILESAAAKLAGDVSDLNEYSSSDYWAATESNARRALLQLVALAKMRPDGVWDGD